MVWYGMTQNLEVLAQKLAELQLFEKSVQIRHEEEGGEEEEEGGKT